MAKYMFKCPRCGNYSVKKNPSDLLTMIMLDVIGFFAIFFIGPFALIIWFILLALTIILIIINLIKIISKKRTEVKYQCTSCGAELLENQLDYKV